MAKKKIDMVTLRCDAIPTLLITTPHVQFEDGLATVPAADAEIILDVLGDDFGITGTAGDQQPDPAPEAPADAEGAPTD
jgi:hypothetical protein|nr:MAG TPA: hypothetical protein [Caudoviricetes sp.]